MKRSLSTEPCVSLSGQRLATPFLDPLDPPEGAVSTPPPALVEALQRALASVLTPRQRELIELHYFDGLSQGDIARQLGISQQVVQKCLFGASRRGRMVGGAIAKLRRALAEAP